jgi:hypothetical protein
MVHLQDSISEHLHHHTLFNMLFNEIFEAHRAQILSCFSLGAYVWLIIQPIFLAFWLFPPLFSITFQMWFGLPHFSIVGLPLCVCIHSIDHMGIHLLHCAHGNEHTRTHDAIHNTFVIIMQDCHNLNLGFMTKVDLQRCGLKVKSKSHISCSRECRRVWRNEPTHSQVGVLMDSWIYREQL